jgi:hypothetical protein
MTTQLLIPAPGESWELKLRLCKLLVPLRGSQKSKVKSQKAYKKSLSLMSEW